MHTGLRDRNPGGDPALESGRKEAGKMDKKGFWERYGGWAALAVTAGLLCLAGITLHDMQTAEGTGLYLAKIGRAHV